MLKTIHQADAAAAHDSYRLISVVKALKVGETKPMGSYVNTSLERGIAFKVEGQYEEAITEFRQLLTEDPNSSDGHYQLGLVYGFNGMFDESLIELQRASMLDPSRLEVRNDLALTFAMLGLNEEAKQEFEEVLRREPNNEKALKNIVFFSEPS